MLISGLQKASLLDYPDKISAIVFTQGCNFRCGYCHNPELFIKKEPICEVSAFLDFLKNRVSKLDAVVITGGEPCLQVGLLEFIKSIKELGFLVKLDTNGSCPKVLKSVLPYLDYIAMDIKAPLNRYKEITNANINVSDIKKSIDIIINSGIDYEFRTTVVRSQFNINDFEQIADIIKGAKHYYLQRFIPSKLLDENFLKETTFTEEEFSSLISLLKMKIPIVGIR